MPLSESSLPGSVATLTTASYVPSKNVPAGCRGPVAPYPALVFDLKGPKIRGGVEFQWRGHWLQLPTYRLGISAKSLALFPASTSGRLP